MDNALALIDTIEERLRMSLWPALEQRSYANTARVMQAFKDIGVDDTHFASVTGYGHHDQGREVTDRLFAQVFEAESAIVRAQFVSGTHAIACALRGAMSPESILLSVTGRPYDTLLSVIGIVGDSPLSLVAQGAHYQEIDVLASGQLDLNVPHEDYMLMKLADVVFIQRSRGYSSHRPSLSKAELVELIGYIKSINPDSVIVVDNCYGEFVETQEPCAWGADLIAGSLIKNPGGGIVPTGGYVSGKASWVSRAADALTCPGIGAKGGYTFELTRTILQGLFLAPMVVTQAMKSMSLFAGVFEALGYVVQPTIHQEPAADIIQRIQLDSPERVLAFTKTLQACSPIGAKLTPEPAITPGYQDPVVMAGGTFIFGSTIELSADAPMRDPYAVFLQGGINYAHSRFVLASMLTHWPTSCPHPKNALAKI